MDSGKIIIPAHYALSDNNPAVVYYDNSRKEELWNIIGADKDGNGDFITYKIVSAQNSSLALTLDGSGVKLAKYTGRLRPKVEASKRRARRFRRLCKGNERQAENRHNRRPAWKSRLCQ